MNSPIQTNPATSIAAPGSSIVTLFVTVIAGELFVYYLFKWLSPEAPSWETAIVVGSIWLMSGAAVLLAAILLFLVQGQLGFNDLGLRHCRRIWIVLGGMLALVLWPATDLLINALVTLGLEPIPAQERTWVAIPSWMTTHFSVVGVTTMFVFVGLVGPWIEEVLFRGIVYGWLRDRWSIATSALVSSALFGAIHIYWDDVVGTFAFGIVAALLYERSKSLWPSVALHVTTNTIYVLMLTIQMDVRGPISI